MKVSMVLTGDFGIKMVSLNSKHKPLMSDDIEGFLFLIHKIGVLSKFIAIFEVKFVLLLVIKC